MIFLEVLNYKCDELLRIGQVLMYSNNINVCIFQAVSGGHLVIGSRVAQENARDCPKGKILGQLSKFLKVILIKKCGKIFKFIQHIECIVLFAVMRAILFVYSNRGRSILSQINFFFSQVPIHTQSILERVWSTSRKYEFIFIFDAGNIYFAAEDDYSF